MYRGKNRKKFRKYKKIIPKKLSSTATEELAIEALRVAIQQRPFYFESNKKVRDYHLLYGVFLDNYWVYTSCDIILVSSAMVSMGNIYPKCRPIMTQVSGYYSGWVDHSQLGRRRVTENEGEKIICDTCGRLNPIRTRLHYCI